MRSLTTLLAGGLLCGSALAAVDETAALTHYADMPQAEYADALATARSLQQAVDGLIAAPSDATLAGARAAWQAARVPYQ